MLKTEQFYELDQDIIDYFKDVEKDFAFAMDMRYIFQCNTKQKQLISVKKIADNFAVLLNKEILVTVNEEYYNLMDEEIIRILFEQEIDKITINFDKGTLKIVQPSLKTSTGIVHKHTYEKVERAYETERLLGEQKKDENNG